MCTRVQAQFVDPREANEFFKKGNYPKALEAFKKLIRQEPANPDYKQKAGECILRGHMVKTEALDYLKKAATSSKADKEVWFDLGMAYQYHLKFDKAIEMFQKYKSSGGDAQKADHWIGNAQNAKKLIQHPAHVTFTNLGPKVNTPFPDYYPFVAKDESFIAFTSRRTGTTGGTKEFDGFYASDVYIAQRNQNNGLWNKAKNAGQFINSEYDEQCVGLSNDAFTMFVYVDKIKEVVGDIYESKRKTRSFLQLSKMADVVNSTSLETAASISADGKTLFFASDRPGGRGGLDLWMCRKLPNGEWAEAQNLSDKINTQYNEDFPTLSADGHTLYFCSQGHNGMGGYDIYTSEWDPATNRWSEPKNIGYPINSPDDERVISFAEDGRHAYISAVREGGIGDFDIYRVKFEDVEPLQAVIALKLTDAGDAHPITDAILTVYDQYDNRIGDYSPNPNSGTYTIILSPGQYNLEIDAGDYGMKVEKYILNEMEARAGFIQKEIILSK